MWTVRLVFLCIFTLAVVYCDLRYRRVPNRLTFCAAAAGLALAAAGGWSACGAGLCGLVLGFALLLPAFLLGMVGGGDVKSLAVIGVAIGPGLLWIAFMRGVVAAGLVGLAYVVARRWRRGKSKVNEALENCPPAWTLPYAAILSLCAALTALFA
jgi:Flp pilus assembly protein protease CpaA